MHVVGIILLVFCGVAAIMSAIGKLTGQAQVVEILDHVGVSGPVRQALPFLQMLGGAGALLSLIALPAVGVAALVGLALYFAGAVVFHLRAGDTLGASAVPIGLTVLTAVTAIIRAATI